MVSGFVLHFSTEAADAMQRLDLASMQGPAGSGEFSLLRTTGEYSQQMKEVNIHSKIGAIPRFIAKLTARAEASQERGPGLSRQPLPCN